jgi:hypothetical protein
MNRMAALALVLAASAARAEPLRLRADALATTQSPAGLVVLDASSSAAALVSAEAIVWTAGDTLPGQHHGDVLVIALRAHTADGRASARVGRFVATLGALRPVQVDGAEGLLRLPYRFDVEGYAGIPVLPGLATSRSWDWVTGGRVARRLGTTGSVGLAFLEERDDGRLSTEEIGGDAGAALGAHSDFGARAAYDLANPGLAMASVSASYRGKAIREEVYAGYTAASHILPATSLFTVLGDVPSQRAGVLVTWQAAPRLSVMGDLGARRIDEQVAPLRHGLVASSELELVIPDDSRGRGAAWPWGLVALGWDRGPWHAAVAGEASASPEYVHRLDALVTLGRQWGVP